MTDKSFDQIQAEKDKLLRLFVYIGKLCAEIIYEYGDAKQFGAELDYIKQDVARRKRHDL